MSNRLEISIGNKNIVARISEPEIEPDELEVFIEDQNGRYLQTICIVRQNFFTRIDDQIECLMDDSNVQCLVWEDGNDEDYTQKLYVNLFDEKEENT